MKNKKEGGDNRLYSYQDCWKYAFFCSVRSKRDLTCLEQKNNVITLCNTSPQVFWKKFSLSFFSFSCYKRRCKKIKRYLCDNYPVPFLVNKVSFSGLNFFIKEGVFIPQVDTEVILEVVSFLVEKGFLQNKKVKVLEIGTGCGAIAISLAKRYPDWYIMATDINLLSLEVAKKNSNYHSTKVDFYYSDLFENLEKKNVFDIIISNPPYVTEKEYEGLPFLVKKQPFGALVCSKGDFFFYFEIFKNFDSFLANKGFLILEVSPSVLDFFSKVPWFISDKIKVFYDYSSLPRVILMKK